MSSFPGLTSGTWTVDPTHTEVGFVARHLMVAKVRGRFATVAGTVTVGDTLADTSVQASVETASVSTNQADRDAHLRSGDFFDSDTYPAMIFASTSVTEDSMTGELTIKGETHPVTFELEFDGVQADPWGNTKAGFTATTVIKRDEWGLSWGNTPLDKGGVMLGNDVALTIEVQADLQQDAAA